MKSNKPLATVGRTILPSVLCWSLACHSFAQTSRDVSIDGPKVRDTVVRDYSPKFLADRLGVTERSTKLVGLAVRDQASHKLGKLQDFDVDLNTGRIVCVLVAGGDSLAAVPAKCFQAPEGNAVVLSVDKSVLSAAPHFATGADQSALFSSLQNSYAYFNQKVLWTESSTSAQVAKASEMVGFSIKNPAGDSLGKVVNLVVDLPTARVVFAVASFGGGANDLYVIPPTALRLAPAGGALLLDAGKSKIAALAQSDAFFWSNLSDPATAIAAYQNFGKSADFDASATVTADPTKEEVRSKVEPTPAVQKSGAEIKRDVLAALMHDDVNNAIIFNKISMTTENSQITFAGRVKSEKQRAKLIAIAGTVVGAANVRDQLEVK
jgi:sporulation protein YlmC with PRC-barrel domain